MIGLFEHNQSAYCKAVTMLAERGKAAIVHPTGTGKSFIAFKLAEDNSSSRILWLSPSEYIFRTQLENIKSICGYEPHNIEFRTYAKLMQLDSDEIAKLKPDYVILDEFHRVGAEMWGKGVERLFAAYPDVPVLGLSATSIRYLDNRRDMADELFDGNVASEMTLGEAVVRGILTPPEYVLSIYSCSKDIEKYQSRIRRAKTKATRDEAQKKLDALRRSLENAEGIDAVFSKHIKDREGKYIIFCSNVEHLLETETHIHEWFRGVDVSPVIYKAYSEDSESSKAFDSFRKDNSKHLKLLLCIDMLNEGIHVNGVSGVILLRPTVSPIVYKQQIGRALSSGKSGKDKNTVPVIIDIVNNIENLYSISVVEEEMNAAINYYRSTGQEDKIINETFTITDETKDSRQLFCDLEETLSASWDSMYKLAKAYYEKYHNIDIPKRYITENGYNLGLWLNTQKQIKAGKKCGVLSEDRIQKLEAIGIDWHGKYDRAWEKYYNALCKYKYDNGNIDIKANYVTKDGIELGTWVANLRAARRSRRKGFYLTDARIAMLDKLGMIWNKFDYQWEKYYQAGLDYYIKNDNLDIPANYVTKEGLRLGAWVIRMRKTRDGRLKGASPLTQDQIDRLDAIQMNWQDSFTRQWEYGYKQAKAYFDENGNLDVPTGYVSPNGFQLGKWLKRHIGQNEKTAIKITPDRKAKLDALGFKWESDDVWNKRIVACIAYKQEHGDLNIPQHYVTPDGMWLGKWLYECRKAYRNHEKQSPYALTKTQLEELQNLGVDWRLSSEKAWDKKYAELSVMLSEIQSDNNAALKYPASHSLRQWLSRQRIKQRQGKLSNEQTEKLSMLIRSYIGK